ncbi:hypothetical protein GCM10009020_24590 [Natronoarchaeum mannanilyticum]|uniref:YdbS-like PH domain-containing protein n=1 Tax=Natronoarchaeum mannanilyticum TaxID=926360 RepID=A0AAV3TBS2_9EURY
MSGNEPSETSSSGRNDEASSGRGEETPTGRGEETTSDDDDSAASSGESTPQSGAESDESSASQDDTAGSAIDSDVHADADPRDSIVPDERVPDDVTASDLTIEPRGLDSRVRIVWVLQGLISAVILSVIVAAIASFFVDGAGWIGAATFAVVGTLVVIHSILRYRIWTYEVREDALYLERGVLTRVRTVVPYVRIQHVDASRGPVERSLGLASSVVYTAGTRGADVTIPGLTSERADDLQERLKQLAILADGDDAV